MKRKLQNGIFFILITCFFSCWSRNPDAIFVDIFKEKPKSLKVLNGQDQLVFDCCYWLHFEISKSELTNLLIGFERKPRDDHDWNPIPPPEAKWWNPSKFGINGIYFEKVLVEDRQIQGIYTNREYDEVYFVELNI
jgi:hypothetical protein